jgi:cytochrome c556
MMKYATTLSILCLLSAGAAFAAADLGHEREVAMKKIGHSAAELAAIARGKTKYDAATVKGALTTISTTIKTFPDLFPAGSEKADRAASPKIWETTDDFKAHAAKLGADADAMVAALPADQKAVGLALGKLGHTCGACHQSYRLKD